MVPPDCQPLRDRRLILLVFVISLSVVLPASIVIGSVYSAFSGWPLGLVMVEQHKISAGTIKNGELWYPVTKFVRQTYNPPRESRIVRLDLKTGDSRETGWILPESKRVWEEFDLIWMGEHLYVVDRFATVPTVFRGNESGWELFAALPAQTVPASAFMHAPFFDHGELAVVEQNLDGEFRLARFVNGIWEKGRRVRLPKMNSRWVDAPQRPRIWCDPELRRNRIYTYLTVIPADDDLHIRFVTKGRGNQTFFAAYRKGFEYVDDTEVCSAQSPENAELDSSGWEQINFSANSAVCGGEFSSEQGRALLGIVDNRQSRFVRRQSDGGWKVLSGLDPSTQEFEWDSLLTGPSERSYVCRQSSEWWDRFTFYPIDGDTIGPAQLTLPGHERMYLNRWGRLAGGLLLAWIIHVLVLIGGQQFCHRPTDDYEFGTQKSSLSPPWLRDRAFLIDAMGISLLVAISFSIQGNYLGVKWDRNSEGKISRLLMHAEMNIDPSLNSLGDSLLNVKDIIFDPKEVLGSPRNLQEFRALILTVLIDTFLPLWLYRTYHEGKSGVTFGKWLTGIRTVRSTLRPCGFARAVVRSAMYLVDFALFITPLPATISMMLSPCGQRLGDRVADTVVTKFR